MRLRSRCGHVSPCVWGEIFLRHDLRPACATTGTWSIEPSIARQISSCKSNMHALIAHGQWSPCSIMRVQRRRLLAESKVRRRSCEIQRAHASRTQFTTLSKLAPTTPLRRCVALASIEPCSGRRARASPPARAMPGDPPHSPKHIHISNTEKI